MAGTKTYLLSIIGLLLSCSFVFGQTKFDLEGDFNELYKIDFWNTDTHDFSNTVLSMLQSQDGYIWLGTFDGLYKFDGIEFERIDIKKENEENFANHGFRAILEDSKHTIWFGTNGGGVTFYDPKEKKYTRVLDKRIEKEVVLSLIEDENGDILVGTRNKLLKINKEKKVKVVFFKELGNLSVQFSSKDKDGILWLASMKKGLVGIKSGKVVHHYKTKDGLGSNDVYCSLKDTQNNLWVATSKGLFQLKGDKFIPKIIESSQNPLSSSVLNIYQNKEDGLIWLSTESGLFCLNGEEQFSVKGVLGDKILFSQRDRDGNIWLGTYRRGLIRFKKKKFLSYTQENALLVDEVINTIAEDAENTIWIGGNSGISRWNNNTFTDFKGAKGLVKGRVRGITPTKDKIWIAVYGGVSYFQDGEFHLFEANHLLKSNNIRTIFYDEDTGDLWLGSTRGLYCYTSDKKMLIYAKKELGNANIIFLKSTSQGLAIATDGGGVSFYKNGVFKQYTTEQNLGGNVVFNIYEDSQNNIWISTNGGLTLMQGDELTTFRKTEGLHSNTIFQTMEDSQNRLWFTSNKSVFRLPKQDLLDFKDKPTTKLKATVFTTEDGLPSNTTHVSNAIRTKDNWFVFACLKGVGLIKPSSIQINQVAPKVHIKNVKLDGESINFDTEEIIISPKNKRLNFSFKALSYANPEQVLFKYRLYTLEEEEPKWLETSRNEINYSNLAAGDYIFELSAANSDGVWNEKTTKIAIKKEQYFYKTTAFFILILVCLSFIASLIYYHRLRQHKKAKIKLEKIVAQRTSELSKLAAKVEKHNEELTESYLEISDSINYAKQIQNAILRDYSLFKDAFTDFFIFWKAKDIVSGDFYWAVETQGKVIITVADCTGHGVAGAFMTILGSRTLDKVVLNDGFIKPTQILKQLDEEIYAALHKSDKYKRKLIHEGMDISICSLDYTTKEFVFAGAKSRALYFQKDKMTILDGNRFSVGDKRKKPTELKEKRFSFETGDRLYLFSDGYADQFGGKNNLKYMTHRLVKLVKSLQHLKMKKQKKALVAEIEEWQGNQPQIDDILFVGIEF